MVEHIILWKLKDDIADKASVNVVNGKVRPFTQTRLCLDYQI